VAVLLAISTPSPLWLINCTESYHKLARPPTVMIVRFTDNLGLFSAT
jgi:hypothetical protein